MRQACVQLYATWGLRGPMIRHYVLLRLVTDVRGSPPTADCDTWRECARSYRAWYRERVAAYPHG